MTMITNTLFQAVALAISAYGDEMYTSAKKINSTGLVGTDARIDTSGESYIGQMRWYKPLAASVNIASLSAPAAGTYTTISTDIADYIKTVRTFGAQQVNLQSVVSQQDGLMKIARDFSEVRAQDEHDALMSVLRGVAASEVARGVGITQYTTDATATGFFVDLNAAGLFGPVAIDAATERKLFDSTAMGAARGERLFKAVGAAFKDYEPDFMYMITSPENMAEMRAANLVDTTTIVDGNLTFQTVFGGKFRLLLTRAAQGNYGPDANVNDRSVKTTFIVKPGALSFSPVGVPVPVEVDRSAEAYTGGGTTSIWYRWGYVAHPYGYDWNGATTAFATNAAYAAAASWVRKMDHLNLSVLPIFHA